MSARPPVHPGEILREEFLEEFDLSAYALAKQLHVPANRITGIVNGDRAVTADTALRLGHYFGTTPEFWLNLQAHYDLERAKQTSLREIERQVERRALA